MPDPPDLRRPGQPGGRAAGSPDARSRDTGARDTGSSHARHARDAEPLEIRLDDDLDQLGEALSELRRSLRVRGEPRNEPRELPAESSLDWMALVEVARTQLNGLWMVESASEVDDFGGDEDLRRTADGVLEWLATSYWRTRVIGAPPASDAGPCLFVANGGGLVPWDALVLAHLLGRGMPLAEKPRPLLSDWLMTQPFLQTRLSRLGAVRACRGNAQRLLRTKRSVVAFPEGVKGATKGFFERHRLERFGRGGAVRIALEQGVPLVPIGVVGPSEVNPLLMKAQLPGRWLGLPFFPVTATFPWLGLAGLLPLPTRWVVAIGEPIDLSEYGPDDAADEVLVGRMNEQLRQRVGDLVRRALEDRDALGSGAGAQLEGDRRERER